MILYKLPVKIQIIDNKKNLLRTGLEPVTLALLAPRTTNCANGAP